MPELPDIQVFVNNLKALYVGKKLSKIKVVNGNKLADTAKELSENLEGKIIKDIYRSGKEMRFKFSNGIIMGVHLMLSGDIKPLKKITNTNSTVVELYFSDGDGFALTDKFKNGYVRLNPIDKKGIDALDKELDFKYLKSIFIKRKAQVKNLLIDQNIIRGIGNSYSDEILWKCKISPFSVASAIPDEKIKELVKNIKSTLKKEIAAISKAYPGLIFGEVKEFMNIHTMKKTTSPTGFPIKFVQKGIMKTYYTDEQKLYK